MTDWGSASHRRRSLNVAVRSGKDIGPLNPWCEKKLIYLVGRISKYLSLVVYCGNLLRPLHGHLKGPKVFGSWPVTRLITHSRESQPCYVGCKPGDQPVASLPWYVSK